MGRANIPQKRAPKSVGDLVTCHFPRKGNLKFPWKWKKVFILHKVIIEIAQEVETSFPEVGKRYLLGRRLFLTVIIFNRSCRFTLEEQTFLKREL